MNLEKEKNPQEIKTLKLPLSRDSHLIFDIGFIYCCCSVAKSVWLLGTPWTAECQAFLSFTIYFSNWDNILQYFVTSGYETTNLSKINNHLNKINSHLILLKSEHFQIYQDAWYITIAPGQQFETFHFFDSIND